ncbi:hypothetical protein [Nonomuraea gerenzanensis]|uniref:Phage protein n=1 Tax=Nonomuraea gerenzanensis TaxID=93944 RepID=A0A1M4EMP4_9ACTN|nr:hypothetical protein [Nonomuraea gerenzanensis]UBU11593.1 hypothetical protein LCN96_46020 [Nonomuraea gerenzanensis]SBP00088.1 Phage protein [Nonomuraea gerenzanensis]
MPEILAVCVALVTLAGGGAVAAKLIKLLKKLSDAVDDWQGEPARKGVPARPGVMERLEAIEAQLRPNGGASARDAINRVERTVTRLSDQFHEQLRQQED